MKSCFKNGEQTIGVEWELLLVDETSMELSNVIHPLLKSIGEDPCISLEAFQSCVELKTPPLKNMLEVEKELTSKLRLLKTHCQMLGVKPCSLGAHPFNQHAGKTTLDKRYLDFEEEYPYITRHHLTCSTQLHVSMASKEEAISVMNRLRKYLPVFTALSSSCPYWRGERTGHVSFRQHLTRAAQNSGIPPQFESWMEFEEYFESARSAGFISGINDIHWDIRPRPDLGTLEFRVMDAMPSLSENMALCSLALCLITRLKENPLNLQLLDSVPSWAEKENIFQASHLGLDAKMILSSNASHKSLREVSLELYEELTSTADLLGTGAHLNKVREMILEGPPYVRLMKHYQESRSLKTVVEMAANELFH